MKESIYGWYPSQTDVYQNAQRYEHTRNPYQAQCLYDMVNTGYYIPLAGPKHTPHVPTTPCSTSKFAASGKRSAISRTPSRTPTSQSISPRSDVSSPLQISPLSIRTKPPTMPQPKLWATRIKATPICVHNYPTGHSPRDGTPTVTTEMDNIVDKKTYVMQKLADQCKPSTASTRVKSAPPMKRATPTPKPPRPVKSAGSVRPNAVATPPQFQQKPEINSPASRPASRPRNPTPSVATDQHHEENILTDYDDVIEDFGCVANETSDYDDVIEKYGWRAEIHGDPYGIKKISERLPYTIKCPEPVIPPAAPRAHIENRDTFFTNSIPRRPMAYTIHKEWVSEGIHAQRMALQKREGGCNYRWKNYAFVY